MEPLHEDTSPELAEFWEFVRGRRGGRIAMLDRFLAHSPPMAHVWHDFARATRKAISVPPKLREALILRAVSLHNSSYETRAHKMLGEQAGLTPEQMAYLTGEAESSDEEVEFHARLAEAIVTGEGAEAAMSEAEARYGATYALEALLVVAFYCMVDTFTRAVGLGRSKEL